LVSGAWPGVDYLVGFAFAEVVKQANRHLTERLTQFLYPEHQPDYPGGDLVMAASFILARDLSIGKASAIVLLGGLSGAYDIGLMARQRGKVVLPVADTRDARHEAAYRTYLEMRASWETQGVPGLTLAEFGDLAVPVPGAIDEVIKLLEKLFGIQPDKVSTQENRRSRELAAVKLWQEKLDYLQQQEAISADAAQKFALRKQIEDAREKIRELGG
jgi:hypothetical protein